VTVSLFATGCAPKSPSLPIDASVYAFFARNDAVWSDGVLRGFGQMENTAFGAAIVREGIVAVCRRRPWPKRYVRRWATFEGSADYVAGRSEVDTFFWGDEGRQGHIALRGCQWTLGVQPPFLSAETLVALQRDPAVVGLVHPGRTVRVTGTPHFLSKGGPYVITDRGNWVACKSLPMTDDTEVTVVGTFEAHPPHVSAASAKRAIVHPQRRLGWSNVLVGCERVR
jgi:hypothetical protein